MEIPIQNIYIMLIYSWQKNNENKIVNVDIEDQTSLQNLFAKVLNNGVNHLFKRGFNKDYRLETEEIKSVKGKIDFSTTIKKNLLRNGKLNCEFDEYDEDNIQNQIIKATINKLIQTEDVDQEYKSKLVQHRLRFTGVSDIRLQLSHFSGIRFNSNNRFYEFLLHVCQMICSSLLPSEEQGKYKFREFSKDRLGDLFESFVRNFYRIEQNELRVKRDHIDWKFETITEGSNDYLPRMETDISLSNDERKIIIDTKFTEGLKDNRYEKKKIDESHLYQLSAYLNNTKVFEGQDLEGILLYPSVDGDFDHQFKNREGNKISVKSINLNQNFEEIKSSLKRVIA